MRQPARINTIVPAKTKVRIAALARKTGLKPADVIRIGLNTALDQFEQSSMRLPFEADGSSNKGRKVTMKHFQ